MNHSEDKRLRTTNMDVIQMLRQVCTHTQAAFRPRPGYQERSSEGTTASRNPGSAEWFL